MIFLSILDSATTKPSDLLATLHARVGHAFIPITQTPFVWSDRQSRRNEVVFTNFARNKWSLKVPTAGGYGQGLTVPIRNLFDPQSKTPPTLRSGISPRVWNARSGFQASVAEILQAGKIPIERCHWAYRKRILIVRFDPNDLEAGLPDLARAVGGAWNVQKRTIDFDPRTFREQTRNSIPESVVSSTDLKVLNLVFVRMGVLNASDSELSSLFATNHNSAQFGVDRLSIEERKAVLRYITISLEAIDQDLGPSNKYRKIFDSGRAPYVGVVVNGYGHVGYNVPREGGGYYIFEF